MTCFIKIWGEICWYKTWHIYHSRFPKYIVFCFARQIFHPQPLSLPYSPFTSTFFLPVRPVKLEGLPRPKNAIRRKITDKGKAVSPKRKLITCGPLFRTGKLGTTSVHPFLIPGPSEVIYLKSLRGQYFPPLIRGNYNWNWTSPLKIQHHMEIETSTVISFKNTDENVQKINSLYLAVDA